MTKEMLMTLKAQTLWHPNGMFFTDMNDHIPRNPQDPQIALEENAERRWGIWEINKQEETNAILDIKKEVMDLEAQEMHKIMQVISPIHFLPHRIHWLKLFPGVTWIMNWPDKLLLAIP